MPEMDGFETATTIHRRNPSRHMPIIFLTAAQGNETERAKAYAVGAIDYLLKPYVPSELRTKVTILSDHFRKNEELREQVVDRKKVIWELDSQNLMLRAELNK